MNERQESGAPELTGAQRRRAEHDRTTRTAKEIIQKEAAARDAKTARLRAARLARDAETAGSGRRRPSSA
jgi:hypothetical protein